MEDDRGEDIPNTPGNAPAEGWYVVHATITITGEARPAGHKQPGTHEVDEGVVARSEAGARAIGRHFIAHKYNVPVSRVHVTSVERTA